MQIDKNLNFKWNFVINAYTLSMDWSPESALFYVPTQPTHIDTNYIQ